MSARNNVRRSGFHENHLPAMIRKFIRQCVEIDWIEIEMVHTVAAINVRIAHGRL